MTAHPFMWIQESSRKTVFWAFAALAVAAMVALQVLGGPLKTEAAPAGIVSFELAGTLDNIERILASWDPSTRVYAGLNLGLDFLFIDAYVGAIGLGCVLVAGKLSRHRRALGIAGVLLAWGMLLAGALDCVENFALIRLLLGSQSDALAMIARLCAIPKFLIVFLSLLYVIPGVIASSVLGRGGRKGG